MRYVYQPLDELYMVLITNRQSNILQDIDSLHLFAQVVSSICKSLDEREILRNAYELLSAFDELVTLGYRENLSIGQIKTFLEMESHEERIQEIISRVSPRSWQSGTRELTFVHRTRSLRPRKREKGRQSNWNYNAKKWPEVVVQLHLEHHRIQRTHHQFGHRSRIRTTAMRRRRTNPSS